MALYHEGIDLVAVVSTGQDVWSLKVRGQLVNETWNNIGVNWEPYKNDSTLPFTERGGLEVTCISIHIYNAYHDKKIDYVYVYVTKSIVIICSST